MKVVAVLLSTAVVMAAAVIAEGSRGYGRGAGGNGGGSGDFEPPRYSFEYDVNYDGNRYGHQEERDIDDTTGRYYVYLPDSRKLIVDYYVDRWGYHPTLTYEGEARFPTRSGSGRVTGGRSSVGYQAYHQ